MGTLSNNPYGTKSIDDLGRQAERSVDRIKDKAMGFAEQAADFIRERPAATLLGAVAVGFLVGRIASRR